MIDLLSLWFCFVVWYYFMVLIMDTYFKWNGKNVHSQQEVCSKFLVSFFKNMPFYFSARFSWCHLSNARGTARPSFKASTTSATPGRISLTSLVSVRRYKPSILIKFQFLMGQIVQDWEFYFSRGSVGGISESSRLCRCEELPTVGIVSSRMSRSRLLRRNGKGGSPAT